MKYKYPLYSGIDLRVLFTGVNKLTVTLNNNISFASMTGDNDAKITVVSPFDNDPTNNPLTSDKITESWFALYNALGVNYKVTDNLTGTVQLINRLATTTSKNDSDKTENINDNFRALAGVIYAFNTHVSFESGLIFDINSSTTKITNQDDKTAGWLTFGIPLRFKVVF